MSLLCYLRIMIVSSIQWQFQHACGDERLKYVRLTRSLPPLLTFPFLNSATPRSQCVFTRFCSLSSKPLPLSFSTPFPTAYDRRIHSQLLGEIRQRGFISLSLSLLSLPCFQLAHDSQTQKPLIAGKRQSSLPVFWKQEKEGWFLVAFHLPSGETNSIFPTVWWATFFPWIHKVTGSMILNLWNRRSGWLSHTEGKSSNYRISFFFLSLKFLFLMFNLNLSWQHTFRGAFILLKMWILSCFFQYFKTSQHGRGGEKVEVK